MSGERVGVVGGGFMGGTHAAAWAALGVPVTIFAEDAADAAGVAARTGAATAGSLEALIAGATIVDICTPTDTHAPIALAAAAARRHVICEKPLALSAADGEAIVAACAAAGVRLFVAHVLRYFPEVAEAKRIVDEGAIGDPAVIRLKRAAFRPRKPAGHWLFDPARSGGMVLDLMIHDLDFARWIAGDVVSVQCRSAANERPELGVEHALAILRHASGAISHVTGSWAYAEPAFRTSIEIAGSRGIVAYDSEEARPISSWLHAAPASGQGAVGIQKSLTREDPFRDELADFLGAIREGREARVSAADGLAALRIGLAAVEAARTGRVVDPAEVA